MWCLFKLWLAKCGLRNEEKEKGKEDGKSRKDQQINVRKECTKVEIKGKSMFVIKLIAVNVISVYTKWKTINRLDGTVIPKASYSNLSRHKAPRIVSLRIVTK